MSDHACTQNTSSIEATSSNRISDLSSTDYSYHYSTHLSDDDDLTAPLTEYDTAPDPSFEISGFALSSSDAAAAVPISNRELGELMLEEGKKRMEEGPLEIGGVVLHSALLSGAKSFLPFNPFCCMDRFDNSENARNITVWTRMACER